MGTEFKIGDRVVIKTWDEMKEEYGTDIYGNIACRCSFPKEMEHYCGEEGIIEKIYERKPSSAKVIIRFCRTNKYIIETTDWTFSTDMIKHIVISEKDWIKNMYRKFSRDNNCFHIVNARYTVVINNVTLKSAVAKCSPDDNFNLEYGCAIAYARLIGEKIPDFGEYKELGKVGLFDKFKFGGSTYGIIGTNPKTKEIYVYNISTGDTKHYKSNIMVEIIK